MSNASADENNTTDNKKQRIVEIISSVVEKVGKNEELALNSIVTELRDLLLVIEEARKEIGSARPADIKG